MSVKDMLDKYWKLKDVKAVVIKFSCSISTMKEERVTIRGQIWENEKKY